MWRVWSVSRRKNYIEGFFWDLLRVDPLSELGHSKRELGSSSKPTLMAFL